MTATLMTMNYPQLLRKAAEHVALFYMEHPDNRISFHTQENTLEVLAQVREMSRHYRLNERDTALLAIAAWFLNTGYYEAPPHEEGSVRLARQFLEQAGTASEDIDQVTSLMRAAGGLQPATTLSQQLLFDAARIYTGTESFRDMNKRLRREQEKLTSLELSGEQWGAQSIEQLSSQPFLTEYAKLRFDAVRLQNIEALKERQVQRAVKQQEKQVKKEQKKSIAALEEQSMSNGFSGAMLKDDDDSIVDIQKIKKKGGPIRGIETMFRVSSTNQQRLSVMADNKAHIMISVNSIIISIAIALVIGKFGEQPKLMIPTVLLLAVNVFTIIFSILATRPKVSTGVFTKEQLDNKTVNLLYFGSYYRMGFEDFENGMTRMMNDGDFLYRTMIKNIYWQGKVIGHKFNLLRIAYNIFMYGIAVSVLAYTLVEIL